MFLFEKFLVLWLVPAAWSAARRFFFAFGAPHLRADQSSHRDRRAPPRQLRSIRDPSPWFQAQLANTAAKRKTFCAPTRCPRAEEKQTRNTRTQGPPSPTQLRWSCQQVQAMWPLIQAEPMSTRSINLFAPPNVPSRESLKAFEIRRVDNPRDASTPARRSAAAARQIKSRPKSTRRAAHLPWRQPIQSWAECRQQPRPRAC